jgi:lipid A 3-O-deacylase
MTQVILLLSFVVISLQSAPTDQPIAKDWSIGFETGYLAQIGDSNPFDYGIMPNQLICRLPAHFIWGEREGRYWSLQPRLALLGEAIFNGPESHYLGFAAAPELSYWFDDEQKSVYTNLGGGLGTIDSQGVVGGQGQNFTLTWHWQLGYRTVHRGNWITTPAFKFQHFSNGGQTNPNPGINAAGFTMGISKHW